MAPFKEADAGNPNNETSPFLKTNLDKNEDQVSIVELL